MAESIWCWGLLQSGQCLSSARWLEWGDRILPESHRLGSWSSFGLFFHLGLAYRDQGELDGATKAYFHLGSAYVRQGKFDKAIEAYEKVIELGLDDAVAYRNLGFVYGKQGNFDKAIEAYKRVIELNPDFTQAHAGVVLTRVKAD